MKKVALMTWYKYNNYGTVLQCVSLYNCIRDMGYDVDVVAYQPGRNKYLYQDSPLELFFEPITRRMEIRSIRSQERSDLFEKFKNQYITVTEEFENYSELYSLNQKYDCFVCGSDQIWSMTRSFDDKFYLSFVSDGYKKVSYAPSFGVVKPSAEQMVDMIKGLLSDFTHLSVRETAGKQFIKEITGREAEIVLDPTLLLQPNAWESYMNQVTQLKSKKYIICYFLGDENNYLKNVIELSKTLNAPYFLIPATQKQKNKPHVLQDPIGPAEFVYLIKNASYVCTDSFHGLAFAINFSVPFSIYRRFKDSDPKSQNSRIYSLLQVLNLNDRLEKNAFRQSIDYASVQTKLNQLRRNSLSYLEESIKDATSERNKPIQHVHQDICSGCGACEAVCPKHAIEVNRNENGFLKYRIAEEKCVECGVCKLVCPVLGRRGTDVVSGKKLIAYKDQREEVLLASSSGGAAYSIAEMFIKKGYLVCGAVYNSEIHAVEHRIIDSIQDLHLLQGSKYLQSDTGNCYSTLIESGRQFVFFGTPCQVAGFSLLLEKKNARQRAVLVDIVCHGVPSQLLWDKYIKQITKNTEKVVECNFRDKKYGWSPKTISLQCGNKKYTKRETKDSFYSVFNYAIAYSPSCYECQYRVRSAADIRVGDFWGEAFKNDKIGVSMVVAISEIGCNIVDQLKPYGESSYMPSNYTNIQYVKNPKKPINYQDIISDLKKDTISATQFAAKHSKVYKNIQFNNQLRKLFRRKKVRDEV